MSETTAIVVSIVGTGIGILGVMGLMLRMLGNSITIRIDDLRADTNKQFSNLRADTNKQYSDLRTDMKGQFSDLRGDTNRQFSETKSSLQRIETRIDETNKRIDAAARDIAELRDRTGTLEGTLSTFMNERQNPNAA